MSHPYYYELANDQMSVSYWTVVHGPIGPDGPIGLTYTDANGFVSVPMDEVHRHAVPGVGTVVTATISPTLAAFTTVLAICIPPTDLTGNETVTVEFALIKATTVDPPHANAPETSYEASTLTGTAGRPAIPLVAASPVGGGEVHATV